MSSKILITGGAGFIGSHLADALLAEGQQVRVLDNLSEQVHPAGMPTYLGPNVDVMQGDVRERAVVDRALEDIDVVTRLGLRAQQVRPGAHVPDGRRS